MQKYIYWTLIFVSVLLAQGSTGLKIDKNINTKLNEKAVDFAKNIKQISDKSFLKYGTNIFDNNMTKGIASIIDKNSDNNSTKNTLFYFYSESMKLSAITNLLPQMKKFKHIHPEDQIFIVLNGFPKKEFFLNLRKYYKSQYSKLFSIKIHPYIYKYYKLKMVPAWAYIRCDTGENFRFKKCKREDSLLARGDISLVDFFDVLSTDYKEYKDDYNYLIKAE
ncbi:TrbC family F-type conjugative pilus assembly protein [Sulfurimonas sp.]